MLILYNGNIYTQDPAQPRVEAIAIRDGRIIAAGTTPQILALKESGDQVTNLQGRTVLPGLTDAHIHLKYYAFSRQKINCETATRAECLARVAQYAREAAPGSWILGHGWNQNQWAEGFGSAQDLDQAAPDNPVYLTAKSLHASWANSAALHLAGITAETPEPADGTIARNQAGEPTGILFENASNLLEGVIPSPTTEETVSALESAQCELWRFGLTGAHDFDDPTCLNALQILNEEGKLKLRVLKSIPERSLDFAIQMGLRSGFGSDLLRFGPLKLFADGAMGPRTAAMLAPFEGAPDDCGELFLDEETLFEIGKKAVSQGIHLAVHAIGDRANREILNGYQRIRAYEREQGLVPGLHRIEHVQILSPEDQGRLKAYGITASMQPIHATSDIEISDRHLGLRARDAYVFRTLLDNGTSLVFGSDSPVESPNPFLGIHAAVTRCRPDSSSGGGGWHPEQKISLKEALAAYTLGPARASGMQNKIGRLSPGFYADLIVLENDPFLIPVEELFLIQPAATMVNGEWVWNTHEAQIAE